MDYRETVLVVDDEKIVCDSCKRILTDKGYKVEYSTNPVEGLQFATDKNYAVIILDMKMNEIDGLEFLERLRNEKPDVPVLIITGYPSKENADAFNNLGVSDYIHKPFTPDVLTESVKKISSYKEQKIEPIRENPQQKKSKYFPKWISKIRLTNRHGKKVSLVVFGKLLERNKGVGKQLISKILERSYPLETFNSNRYVAPTAQEILDEVNYCDRILILKTENADKTSESLAKINVEPISYETFLLIVQPDVLEEEQCFTNGQVDESVTDLIIKEMEAP